jgi:hypothetical protein
MGIRAPQEPGIKRRRNGLRLWRPIQILPGSQDKACPGGRHGDEHHYCPVGTLDLEPEFDVELPVAALAFDPPEAKP